MIVQETAEVRKQINNYKRFLEKPELFNHAALLNDRFYYFYYNVQYWRLGKKEAVGYLILRSDGSVPPRSEALPVVLVSRNLVTEEDVLPIYQALHESDFLAYTGLRKQAEIHESADCLYSFFTSVHEPLDHEQKKALGTLTDLLKDYKRKEIRRTMEQSLRSMEVKGVPYRNAEEMRQALDEKNQEIFQQKLFPILRNP
jgi:hypothetical protein